MVSEHTSLERRRIHVDGVVQGVGFRPFIYGLAMRYHLGGWVLNTSSGVDIEVQGASGALDAFQAAITAEAPRLARIDRVIASPIPIRDGDNGFTIRHSQADTGTSLVSPDVSTCPDCLAEIFDPANRRYRYPFTNCTNCGPRYTIIEAMPYDRPQTTMRAFEMCPACRAEYENPLDRRFHAQPNACPACGPHLSLIHEFHEHHIFKKEISEIRVIRGQKQGGEVDALAQAAALLQSGHIIAIKGLGGFHLACDATDAEAVARLRDRKARPDKPFAVMVSTLREARLHGDVDADEEALLTAPGAPIVLLYRRPQSTIAANVAPDNPMLGLMLPYTPLHHILVRDAGCPLVMTSGNLSDLPVITGNDEALAGLGSIADAFLLHNRPIHMRCDDAVWWVDRFAGEQDAAHQPLRRARGDAPYPIRLPWRSKKAVLAVGAEMKNTLCLVSHSDAFLSQHIGEVSSLESLGYFLQVLDHLCRLFKVEPEVIAHDMHPGYLTTRLAHDIAAQRGLPLVAVQHHHAHIAACLAEHGRTGPVIGVSFDGTGYGPDGTIWGGETLIASLSDSRRIAHLEALPLPGGDAAIQRPYRIAWGYLLATQGTIPDLPGLAHIDGAERAVVGRQVAQAINAPLTSSVGRLFDAVSAMLGICPVTTFEAQAAIALELAAREAELGQVEAYPFSIDDAGVIRLGDLLAAITADVSGGRPTGEIAAAFHVTVAHMALQSAELGRAQTGLDTVVLSGGSFQNRMLLRLTRDGLRSAGFEVLTHRQTPTNDGGLSLGQAVMAMSRDA